MSPNPGSPGVIMAIFFAANPDEWLTTSDVVVKTNASVRTVYNSLTHWVRAGYLTRDVGIQGRMKTECTYSAGPTLLALIGRSA